MFKCSNINNSSILKFDFKNNKIILGYGKNGCGKTTISKKLIKYVESKSDITDAIELKPEYKKENIYVYNEDFIDKNVKFKENGLEAIVIFGKQIEVDERIEEINSEINEIDSELEEIRIEKYENESIDSSIPSLKKQIVKKIKKDLYQNIKEVENKSRIVYSDNDLNRIVGMKITVSDRANSTYKNKYYNLKGKVKGIKNKEKISDSINIATALNLSEIKILLEKSYAKDTTTEFSKILIEKINSKQFDLPKTRLLINKKGYCPTCLQYVSDEKINQLEKTINEYFDDYISKEMVKLESKKIETINQMAINNTDDTIVNEVNKYNLLISEFNNLIANINKKIDEKITNPYEVIVIDINEIEEKYNSIVSCSNNVNGLINDYNKNIDEYEENKKELLKIIDCLFYIENHTIIEKYINTINEFEKSKKRYKDIVETKEKLKKELETLNSKKENIDIAIDNINKRLRYIFTDARRLYLEKDNENNYIPYSRDKKITLKDLSVGERNLISLCYFFESIKRNTSINLQDKRELFALIDDPISSFDYENKLSICNFIIKEIKTITQNNDKNKIIILSHDLQTILALKSILKNDDLKYEIIEIKENGIYDIKNTRVYSDYIESIYNFAFGDSNDINGIGNTMRKALEAYCTFNYNKGTKDLMKSLDYQKYIKNDIICDYFKNNLFSVILDSKSHEENKFKSYPNIFSEDEYSNDGLKKVSKDILLLIYYIHPLHLEMIIKDETKIKKIKEYENELIEKLTF